MWKPVGVVGLWLFLIAAPHVGARKVQMTPPGGVQLAANDPAGDPGDPFLEGDAGAADADAGAPRAAKKAAPTALATIHFKNGLDKTLDIVSVTLSMDGEPLAPVTDLRPEADNVVFSGHLTPGEHVVTTHLTCQGTSRGPFTYLSGYRWDVASQQTLTLLDSRSMIFTISAVRHKGMNVPLDKLVDITVYNELLPQPVSEGARAKR